MGSGDVKYSIGVNSAGEFKVKQGLDADIFSFDNEGNAIVR